MDSVRSTADLSVGGGPRNGPLHKGPRAEPRLPRATPALSCLVLGSIEEGAVVLMSDLSKEARCRGLGHETESMKIPARERRDGDRHARGVFQEIYREPVRGVAELNPLN